MLFVYQGIDPYPLSLQLYRQRQEAAERARQQRLLTAFLNNLIQETEVARPRHHECPCHGYCAQRSCRNPIASRASAWRSIHHPEILFAPDTHAVESYPDPELLDFSLLPQQRAPERRRTAPAPALKKSAPQDRTPKVERHVTFEDILRHAFEERKKDHTRSKSTPSAPATPNQQPVQGKRYPRDPRANLFYKWYAANHSNPLLSSASNTDGAHPNLKPRDPAVNLERKPAIRKSSSGTPAPSAANSAPSVSFHIPISSPTSTTSPLPTPEPQPIVNPGASSNILQESAQTFHNQMAQLDQALHAQAQAQKQRETKLREQAAERKRKEKEEKEREAEEAAREQARLIRRYDSLASLTSIRSDFLSIQETASHPSTPSVSSSTLADATPTAAVAKNSHKAHEENLLRLLERLDGVDSDGDDVIRFTRRSLVKEVEGVLEELERDAVVNNDKAEDEDGVDSVAVAEEPKGEVVVEEQADVHSEAREDEPSEEFIRREVPLGLASHEYEEIHHTSPTALSFEIAAEEEVIQRPATAPPVLEQGIQTDSHAFVGEEAETPLEVKEAVVSSTSSSEEVTFEDPLVVRDGADAAPAATDIPKQVVSEVRHGEVHIAPVVEETEHTFPPPSSAIPNFPTSDAPSQSSDSESDEPGADSQSEREIALDSPQQALTDIGSDIVILTDDEEDAEEPEEKQIPHSEVGQFEFL